jgi:hypothetical protein
MKNRSKPLTADCGKGLGHAVVESSRESMQQELFILFHFETFIAACFVRIQAGKFCSKMAQTGSDKM